MRRGEPVGLSWHADGLRPCRVVMFLLYYNLRSVYDVDALGQLAEHVGGVAFAYIDAVDGVNLHCAVSVHLDAADADRCAYVELERQFGVVVHAVDVR